MLYALLFFTLILHPSASFLFSISFTSDEKTPKKISLGQQYESADEDRSMILEAMHTIEKHSCVRFVHRIDDEDYIYIRNTNGGCFVESVGNTGGAQEVSLQSNMKATCMSAEIVLHELLHVCGLWHEQMRSDRDDRLKIMWENVAQGMENQFTALTADESSTYGVPYDYESIMHYERNAFGKQLDSITMQPADAKFAAVIGKAKKASPSDWLKLNRIYNCSEMTTSTLPTTTVPAQDCTDKLPKDVCQKMRWLCQSYGQMKNYCKVTCGFCYEVEI